jgi:hypothetical protein
LSTLSIFWKELFIANSLCFHLLSGGIHLYLKSL